MDCSRVSRDMSAREGVVYLPSVNVSQKLADYKWKGQAWSYNNIVTSYMPNRDVLFKSIHKLNPTDDKDFLGIITECHNNKLSAPSSFADIFHQWYRSPLPTKSAVSGFYGINFGGWQEALTLGTVKQPIYHYDLNQAYRWAASQPLPDVSQASPTHNMRDEWACYLLEIEENELPYDRERGLKMVTSEEVARWKLETRPVLFGVKFHKTVNLAPTFQEIADKFPHCQKRVCRSFWGRWNTTRTVNQCSWKSGPKQRALRNFLYNPFWPAFITSRVKMRLAKHTEHSLHVFVDSMLSLREMPVSTDVGGWKLVDQYDELTIMGPGQYASKGYFIKHCGVKGVSLTH